MIFSKRRIFINCVTLPTLPTLPTFLGQQHEWEIHNFLQKGKEPTLETFRQGLVFSAEQFVIYIPDRIWRGEYVSLWKGIQSISSALLDLPVQLFGGNETRMSRSQSDRIEEIRKKVLLQSLVGE